MAAPPPNSVAEDVASKDEDSVGDQQTLLNQTAACYSDSADSDQSKHYSKKRFSPFQVETLKRVFAQSPYITQSQAAALARRTGLKKLQVRKWFSDYRCKIKKQSILLEQFSSAHAAAIAAAAAAAAKGASAMPASDPPATVSLLDDEEPEPEPDDSNDVATEEQEQEDNNVQEEEEDAGEEEEEEEEDNEEEEEGEAPASEEAEAEEEADADDDTDIDMNAEIDQMIAARSVRPITIVFGKRSRKRAKKREKERSPGGIASGPAKRGRKKKKKDGGSDSGGGCSVATDNQSQTVKRFSPHQVEMLKKAYADSPYITQRQAAVLARSIGLKKMQVRKWFCDHRCKIKKQSLRLQTEGFVSMQACERKATVTLNAPAQIPSTRKSLLERLTGGDQPRVDTTVAEDDDNVDFTDSDDPHAANGLDDSKGGQSMSKTRIILPRRTFRFNEKQLAVLNEEFDKSQFLNDDTLTYLCDKLQERRERIQTWFKMRRYKLRQSEQRFWQNIMDSS